MQNLRMTSESHPRPEDIEVIRNAVDQFNVAVTNDANYSPIAIFLRDERGAVLGGVLGDVWGGWLHITFLWVAESLRHQSYGGRLLGAAEEQARAQGGRNAYLETFSFQARPFYERFGYQVFAELPDFPAGHTYYFMQKAL